MWIVTALLTAVCWGFSYVAAGQLLKTTDKVAYLCFSCFVNLIFYSTFFVTAGKSFDNLWTNKAWLTVALVSSVLGNYLTYYAIELKDATRAAMVEVTYPLWCAILTVILVGDGNFTWKTWAGAFLIMGGVLTLLTE